jgi:hypothetical protein
MESQHEILAVLEAGPAIAEIAFRIDLEAKMCYPIDDRSPCCAGRFAGIRIRIWMLLRINC